MTHTIETRQPGAVNVLRNARSFYDIDSARDEFLNYIKKEYAINIPDNIIADKRTLYKYLKDFYQSRGSEKSLEFMFRIFFDESSSVKYPSENILRTSDGKWTIDQTIKIRQIAGDPYSSISRQVTCRETGASAVVDRIVSYQEGTTTVYEMYLLDGSITGTFLANDIISWDGSSGRILYSVTGIDITNPGTGYSVGDIIRDITETTPGSSKSAMAQVSAVDSNGGITKVNMLNFGSNYLTPPSVSVVDLGDGNAVLTTSVGAVCKYPGYYRGVDGQLSENIKLQDSKYYQAFSYVIRVGRSIDSWREIVKQTIHPAGLALFGETVVNMSADLSYDNQIYSSIFIEKNSINWVNDTGKTIVWTNKYNNQVVWVNT